MTIRFSKIFAVGSCVILLGLAVSGVLAQQEGNDLVPEPAFDNPFGDPSLPQPGLNGGPTYDPPPQIVPSPALPAPTTPFGPQARIRQPLDQSRIQQAQAQLRKAKTPEEKEAAREKLVEALSNYFDEDLKSQEQEINAIEERVEKLRVKLEARREAKQKILDLQVQLMVNEAEGLGFYNSIPAGPSQTFGVPAGTGNNIIMTYPGGNDGFFQPVPIKQERDERRGGARSRSEEEEDWEKPSSFGNGRD